jgi:methyl-accepting chemotaxis protein
MAESNGVKPCASKRTSAKAAPALSRATKSADVTTSKQAMYDAFDRSMALIEFNTDGKILWANDNFLNTIGCTLDEIRGRHHSLFVDPEYRSSQEYHDFWYELGQGISKVARFKRIGKGGREIYLQAAYSPVLDENGTTIKVVKLASDVTEDAHRESRIQERERVIQQQVLDGKQDLEDKVSSLSLTVESAAQGDLTKEVAVTGSDDLGRLGSSLGKMICDLRGVIAEVMAAAQQQNEGARTKTPKAVRT